MLNNFSVLNTICVLEVYKRGCMQFQTIPWLEYPLQDGVDKAIGTTGPTLCSK